MKINNLVKALALSCLVCSSSLVSAMNPMADMTWIQSLRKGNEPLYTSLNQSFKAASTDVNCRQQATFESIWNAVQPTFQGYTSEMRKVLKEVSKNEAVTQMACLEITQKTLLSAGNTWSIGLASWNVNSVDVHTTFCSALTQRQEEIDAAIAELRANKSTIQEQSSNNQEEEVLPSPIPEAIHNVRQKQLDIRAQEVGTGWKILGCTADLMAIPCQWIADHQHYPIRLLSSVSATVSWFAPCPWTVTIGLTATSIASWRPQILADGLTTFGRWCRGEGLAKAAVNTITNGAIDQAEAVLEGR